MHVARVYVAKTANRYTQFDIYHETCYYVCDCRSRHERYKNTNEEKMFSSKSGISKSMIAMPPEITPIHRPNFDFVNSVDVRKKLTQYYGISSTEIDQLSDQAEAMKPYARVIVRAPLSAFENIVQDGGIKTVSDTLTSNGLTGGADCHNDRLDAYISLRQKFESEKLGWDETKPHIVYGFLGYTNLDDNIIQLPVYGRVELKLHPDTIERSSFTIGDSLGQVFNDCPPELLKPDDAILVQQALELGWQQPGHKLNQIPFVETQIHNGVGLRDIESAIITIKPSDLEGIEPSLDLLHSKAPDCNIVVDLDFTNRQILPIAPISRLPFVTFRPIVISRYKPISIARKTPNYLDGGEGNGYAQENHYRKMQERVSTLGKISVHYPELPNWGDPALTYYRNGDRFPSRV